MPVQFVLTADVQRIGRLATPSIVPHQLAAGEGDLSEHAELQKISNLLITEWSQFVAREKKVCTVRRMQTSANHQNRI